MQEPVVIIGAGPAGLTAAYYLTKHGVRALVLEGDPCEVGGISRTARHRGNRFDIGGHRFFTKNAEIHALWVEILGRDDFRRVSRLSRILYDGKFYSYPLKPAEALRNVGLWTTLRIGLSYLKARLFPRRPERSFEDWVSNRFGYVLFSIFFKSYTEKVWGISTSELSADWAAQRIQGLSLWSTLKAAFSRRKEGQAVAKTLIDSFHYPRLGPGMMWERARDLTVRQGGEVRMGQRVVEIRHAGGRVTGLTTEPPAGARAEVPIPGYAFSSMPVRDLVRALRPAPPDPVLRAAESLRYRDFLTVVLVLDQPELFPDNWIYIHDPGVKVGRIQNFKNWSPDMLADPGHTTVLGLEYFCNVGDPLWSLPDSELIDLGKRELERIHLTEGAQVLDSDVVRMEKAYPVYDDEYKTHVRTIRDWLETNAANLTLMGRNGMHKYNNQDHSMLTALLAAKTLLGEGQYDVWRVHTDAIYDEEGERREERGEAGA